MKLRLSFLAVLAAFCTFTPALWADGSSRAWHGPYDRERHHAVYWTHFYPGMVVNVLPAGFVQVSVGATGYYYYDGVYFRPTTVGSYAVVAPPVGVVVPQLPLDAEPIAAGPVTYYYAAGAFYVQQPTGFAAVVAPAGLTVTELPPGAAPIVINQVLYYQAGSSYFVPLKQGGVMVYVTAQV
jgi:uncharacterized protein DUF6515